MVGRMEQTVAGDADETVTHLARPFYALLEQYAELRKALQAIYDGTGEAKHNPREFARAVLDANPPI
jgi:hypothetical protein